MVQPRFAVSHRVSGSCVMRLRNVTDAANLDITIPEGRYWTDPIYGEGQGASDNACLLGRIVALLTASAGDAQTYYKSYAGYTGYLGGVARPYFTTVAGTKSIRWEMGNAVCTAAGRLVARRLGIDQISLHTTLGAVDFYGRLLQGMWEPGRRESGDIDTKPSGFGVTNRAYDGTLYTADIGEPLFDRIVRIGALPKAYARQRETIGDVTLGTYDYSFETCIYNWLARGEFLRYYHDGTLGNSAHLTAALTATSNSVSVSSSAFVTANNTAICVDGEWMLVTSGANTTTLTVNRERPVAHVKHSPASKSFVGTFALANDGGNINRRAFAPRRRAVNQDRWDLEISLLQGAMP